MRNNILILFLCLGLTSFFNLQAQDSTTRNGSLTEQKNEDFNENTVKELKADVEKLKSMVVRAEWVLGLLATVVAIISIIFGKKIIDAVGKDLIIEVLASKIDVEKSALEATIKAQVKDFNARNKRKILILSKGTSGDIHQIKSLLTRDGFDRTNLKFGDFDNKDLGGSDVDLIIFNDKFIGDEGEYKLDIDEIGEYIADKKRNVGAYLYFGSENQLPLNDWRNDHDVKVMAANFPDTLPRNLLNILKTLD